MMLQRVHLKSLKPPNLIEVRIQTCVNKSSQPRLISIGRKLKAQDTVVWFREYINSTVTGLKSDAEAPRTNFTSLFRSHSIRALLKQPTYRKCHLLQYQGVNVANRHDTSDAEGMRQDLFSNSHKYPKSIIVLENTFKRYVHRHEFILL